jgi:hypothetical protein
VLLMTGWVNAQSLDGVRADETALQPAAGDTGLAQAVGPLVCESTNNERKHCAADTSAGVALTRSTGSGACLLGKTWGYDDTGVWVSGNCGGEFTLGQTATGLVAAAPAPTTDEPERPTYGVFDATGQGFLVGRTKHGELKIGGYAVVRWVDQLPGTQDFTDHLGNVHPIDTRNDIQWHRAMVHFRGWLGSPKFRYQMTVWTVMSTDQMTIYGLLGYQFHKAFNLYGGTNSTGGSRSVYGSHPFWLANDRVMADEFFRGSFTNGVWANGEVAPGLWYNVAVGNNFSQLGVTAKQLDRGLATGGSMWWMPTTHEFGPNGAYGDWEYHEKLATRFGFTTTRSKEDRQEQADQSPENTSVRLADSLNVFDPGALARNVTVNAANVRLLSFDAAIKHRGVFLQTEIFNRWLDNFAANGPLPVTSIHDKGFYVQAAFFPIKKKLELYGATSWIYGDKAAGFENSHEYLVGGNAYWFDSRNVRSNFQVIHVDYSAASSTFGFYVGGQTGTTLSIATSFLF